MSQSRLQVGQSLRCRFPPRSKSAGLARAIRSKSTSERRFVIRRGSRFTLRNCLRQERGWRVPCRGFPIGGQMPAAKSSTHDRNRYLPIPGPDLDRFRPEAADGSRRAVDRSGGSPAAFTRIRLAVVCRSLAVDHTNSVMLPPGCRLPARSEATSSIDTATHSLCRAGYR